VYSRPVARVARASEKVEAHRPPVSRVLRESRSVASKIAFETASSSVVETHRRRTGARPVTEINGNATPTIDRRACIDVADCDALTVVTRRRRRAREQPRRHVRVVRRDARGSRPDRVRKRKGTRRDGSRHASRSRVIPASDTTDDRWKRRAGVLASPGS